MAFNDAEQNIIKWGLQNGKTKEQVLQAITNYRTGVIPQKTQPTQTQTNSVDVLAPAKESLSNLATTYGGGENGIANKLKTDIQQGASDIQRGIQMGDTTEGRMTALKGILKSGARVAGDVAGTVYAPIGALLGATGINKVFDKIGELSQMGGKYNPINAITDMKSVQNFVIEHPNLGEDFTRALNIGLASLDTGKIDPKTVIDRTITQFRNVGQQTVSVGDQKFTLNDIHDKDFQTNIFEKLTPEQQNAVAKFDREQSLKLNIKTAKALGKDTTDLETALAKETGAEKGFVSKTPSPSEISKTAQNITGEVLPTVDRLVNYEVTRGLDLTQGDVKNISLSTGNEVGEFLANKNLIGGNKAETVSNIDSFYKENYKAVRDEIGKVTTKYKASEVPRYKEALLEIKKQTQDVAGLQEASKEVDALLKKKTPTLNDVQRVKELMDEHFSLYKAVGDVKEGIAKKGLANMRGEIKRFIEQQVKQNTGVDIKELNNNVQTSRSIADAIETRSTRGLTRSNLKLGDLGIFAFGSAVGTPLTGAALLLGKKIIESPTFRLKFAKWLDGLSDARKASVARTLENGKVPPEVKNIK